jgi:pimeloyl-ACP methyl ester carboxylesterase
VERTPNVSITRRSVVANGVRLAYEVAGSGPLVVCIQGVGVAGSGWGPQRQALASRFTVLTLDNRGIGDSAIGSAPVTIDAMSADAAAVMDAERAERAHVVGHSMGGLIALHLALARPQAVRSLALLCTCADGADVTGLSLRMALLGLRCRVGTRRMRRNAMLDMVMPQDVLRRADRSALARELGALFGHDLADQLPIASAQLRAMSRFSARSRLSELAGIPTLVTSGRHDPIAPPRLGRDLADHIPGARYEEYLDASHALPIQCAERLNAQLLRHLTTAEARAHILYGKVWP